MNINERPGLWPHDRPEDRLSIDEGGSDPFDIDLRDFVIGTVFVYGLAAILFWLFT